MLNGRVSGKDLNIMLKYCSHKDKYKHGDGANIELILVRFT